MAEALIHPSAATYELVAQKQKAEEAIHPSAVPLAPVHPSVATHELVAAQQMEEEAIHPSEVPLAEGKTEEAPIP